MGRALNSTPAAASQCGKSSISFASGWPDRRSRYPHTYLANRLKGGRRHLIAQDRGALDPFEPVPFHICDCARGRAAKPTLAIVRGGERRGPENDAGALPGEQVEDAMSLIDGPKRLDRSAIPGRLADQLECGPT